MKRQQIIRVGAIVAVAGITGFVVQSQDTDRRGPVIAAATPQAEPAVSAVIEPHSVVTLSASETAAPSAGPGLTLAGATGPGLSLGTPPAPVAESAAPVTPRIEAPPTTAELPSLPAEDPALDTAAACSDDMALIPQVGAMLDIGLLAECRIDQRVLIRHGGLVVTGQTSASGTLIASIPALMNPAEVELVFADGTQISQIVEVPDLGHFDRFAVQWMADDAFQLHALERGAKQGEPGHISAADPRRPSAEGLFLSIIGDDRAERPLMAEVFTWPAQEPAQGTRIELTIESAVTEATCNREILGETLQLSGGRLLVRDLTMEMPGCDAVGEFVVLSNPVATEKFAAN